MLHSRNKPISGAGKTLNFGSRGILFTTEEQLPIGYVVELSVDWPAMLDGTCALKFVAVGRVIRSERHRAAVRIDRYQFKTRGSAAARQQADGDILGAIRLRRAVADPFTARGDKQPAPRAP
jgi:hypothetical protein